MVSHEVTLRFRNGGEETLDVGEDEAITDATERRRLGVPFGCLYGACGTCTGRLLDGDVVHVEPPRALKARHLDEGYVLLCIAQPRSPCRIEVGASVQADLVSNPWR